MLLSVDWRETDLNNCVLNKDLEAGSKNLSERQNELIARTIEYIPEWKRLTGCRQHDIHDYTLDIHTLSVLKNVQLHNDYSELNDIDKLRLVYAALLHDIEKKENEVDPEHPVKGAKQASLILYRLGFNEDFINDVYLLVRYHQILGLMLSDKISLTEDELYNMFKKDIIVDLQAILSAADIKSVKKDGSFYKERSDEKFKKIKQKIKSFIAGKI